MKREKLTIKDAAKYLEHRGIGTGTNITVNLTADLMVGFANEHLLPLPDEKENPYWYWPQCDVNRCKGVSSSGGVHWKETGYWSICDKHSAMCRAGEPQPKMRKSAIDKEASRDPKTGYLPSKSNQP